MAYGARLESVLGATPREFESRILRTPTARAARTRDPGRTTSGRATPYGRPRPGRTLDRPGAGHDRGAVDLRRTGSRLGAPGVWLLALGWLALQGAASAAGKGLDAYDRGATSAGRAVVRAARVALRALGPLGRLLRRLLAPPLRVLRRLWDAAGVWLMTRMFRPLGRLARAVVERLRPVAERLSAWAYRVVAVLLPVLRALTRAADAVERAAARLRARLARTVAPVRRRVLAVWEAWGVRAS